MIPGGIRMPGSSIGFAARAGRGLVKRLSKKSQALVHLAFCLSAEGCFPQKL
jgi:hypothetical protein